MSSHALPESSMTHVNIHCELPSSIVFSRVWTLWAVMHPVRSAQTTVFFVLACTSWGLVEVPRYLFYALNLINAVPYPLFWLRYRCVALASFYHHVRCWLCKLASVSLICSLFAVLYPTGITGEVGCMIQALMYMATRVVRPPFDCAMIYYPLSCRADLMLGVNTALFGAAPGSPDPHRRHRVRAADLHPRLAQDVLPHGEDPRQAVRAPQERRQEGRQEEALSGSPYMKPTHRRIR